MTLIETSLAGLWRERPAMPWPRLSRLLSQLVEATRMLHRRKGLLCGVSPDIMRVTTDEEKPYRI